tara:strand:- start:638 stop:3829 length:3192 start_codon:yes stop_codon:yes gene_type:complete
MSKQKSEIKEDFSIIENFISALNIEFEESKKRNIEKQIVLENGERGEQLGSKFLYTFFLDQDLRIGRAKDDMPVQLILGDESVDATIVSVAEKKVVISSDRDFGPILHQVTLKIDNSYLIEKLKKVYEEFLETKEGKINLETLKKTLFLKKGNVSEEKPNVKKETLNNEQFQAVKTSLGSDIVYIWGPPGTGKTHCISKVIEAFYYEKKKVLLVSNTNAAVDIVVKNLGDRLYKKDKDFDEGSVLRYGDIVNETLYKKYGEYVNVDKAAERLSQKLILERKKYEKQIEDLNKEAAPHKKIVDAFNNISQFETQLKNLSQRESEMTGFLDKANQMIEDANLSIKNYNKLIKEYEDKGFFGKFFSEDPETQERKINSKKGVIDSVNEKKKSYPAEIKKVKIKIHEIEKKTSQSKKVISGKNFEKESKSLQVFLDKIDKHSAEIQKINNQIQEVKSEVLKNCRVLAATATKTYLKPEDFSDYDVVIIDEASMLILPQAAYAASLSKEKVVLAGDFMQLPPIVTTDKKHTSRDVVDKYLCHAFDFINVKKLISKKTNNIITLKTQYRMNQKICSLINKYFYDNNLITDVSVKDKKYPKLINDNLILIDTASAIPFCQMPAEGSRYNLVHAAAIRNLCVYLKNQDLIKDITSVGVTTPYKRQQITIDDLLKEHSLNDIVTGTVHRFQGDQKDIIIFDIPDSEGVFPSPLIEASSTEESGSKLMNVAFSRSKDILIVFANIVYLQERLSASSILRNLIVDLQTRGKVIDLKEIIKLGPFNLPSRPKLSPQTKIQIKDDEAGWYNENDFEKPFENDLKKAKKSIVIFSAFCTEKRTAYWGDILRQKKEQGVKIRVVTRGPVNQGASLKDTATLAIKSLIKLKINVDLRKDIHHKMVFIDDNIVWNGSLNVLSYGGKSTQAETFIKFTSKAFAQRAARNSIYKSQILETEKNKKIDPVSMLAERENRDCESCGKLTEVWFRRVNRAPFLKCISCGKTQDMKKRSGKNLGYEKTDAKGKSKMTAAIKEETRFCPKCKNKKVKLVLKNSRYGPFYSCSNWKRDKSGCNHTEKV